MKNEFGFGTTAIHAGQKPDKETGAVMTPIYLTSTYAQLSPGVLRSSYDYSRTSNPTRTALEANIAALEGGNYGTCFSSGCAAVTTILHLLKSGDHVVLSDDVYGGTYRLFSQVFAQLGIEFTQTDMVDLKNVTNALKSNTKLIWIETPTNPCLKIVDIAAICSIAKQHGALSAVDNTFATPYLQRPLELGADITCHSTTKYIGGHSDVLGGAVVVNDKDLGKRMHYFQNAIGAVPSALDCFLLLRSTKTLHVRMERHCTNAMLVAQFLEGHPKVKKVIYPGLKSHPQHEIAKTQMKDFGGMISVVLDGDLEYTKKFFERIKMFALGESLGGVESLIEHPAIMTHASIPAENRRALGIEDSFVRLSIGIEDSQDLIADLKQALG